MRRIPALDGLRGVAILLVMAHHAGHLSGGVYGVHLFFVLSGFLITTILLDEWRQHGRVSLLRFYRRRALRLLPALFVMLAVIVGVEIAGGGSFPLPALYGVLYVSNFAKALGVHLAPLSHLWTLAQEEQFYLLWPPVLLVLLLGRRVNPRRMIVFLAAAAGLAAAHRLELAWSGAATERVISAPDTMSDPLLVGCAAGVAYTFSFAHRAQRLVARAGWLWLLAIAVVIAVGATPSVYVVGIIPLELATAALILALMASRDSVLSRALSFRPLVGVGVISYGLYLWHDPLYSFGWPAGTVLAFAAALLSYRYVEQPFLRMKARLVDGDGVRRASRRPAVSAQLGGNVAELSAFDLGR
jgi:peptidoglycan/LPS O-acetylase OafA/YrhL